MGAKERWRGLKRRLGPYADFAAVTAGSLILVLCVAVGQWFRLW